jgi:pyridinium-3,5-bisthiocarboxylic acid mononucleotide nickel chelatase
LSRLVYFDCASGASGDMILGALVDLGLPLATLRGELAKMPLTGYRLEARHVDRSGLRATKVDVIVDEDPQDHDHRHHHDHHDKDHDGQTASRHRGLREILALIEASSLRGDVKERSAVQFRRLAEAEGAVHGVPPEDVHFHEVGAVDSIVDVVGGILGLAWLRADRFVASPLNVGTGTVKMSHGTFPVPPPATAALVKGATIYASGEGERLTPTGALLVTGHATSYGALPAMRIEATGYGAGSRDTPGGPNVLRLLVGEEGPAAGAGDRVIVLEAEIDDMSPQLLAPLLERLLAAGALDAYYTPIQMKKARLGILVTVLSAPGSREPLEELLFRETTTLGVRRQEWDRTVLERHSLSVDTPYGPIRVKVGSRGGVVYNAQPEFEDCQRVAEARGIPVKEIWAAALAAYRGPGPRG